MKWTGVRSRAIVFSTIGFLGGFSIDLRGFDVERG